MIRQIQRWVNTLGPKLMGKAGWEQFSASFEVWARKVGNWIRLPFHILKILCLVVGFSTIGLFGFTAYSTVHFLNSLPDLGKMKFADLRATAQGRVAEKLPHGRMPSPWIAIADVSRDYLYSIVVSEDATFFEHDGVNFTAMIDSFAENLKERKPAFGASTISQQVVKNLFLTNEKTYLRKLKEILITRELEHRFSKNEILELYLNVAEMGPDLFGVEAASRHYFHKSPSSVNAAEGAFIALMLPSPRRHYYSIFQNRNLSKAKRKRLERVLRDMLYEDFITERQYREYTHYSYWGSRVERAPARSLKP